MNASSDVEIEVYRMTKAQRELAEWRRMKDAEPDIRAAAALRRAYQMSMAILNGIESDNMLADKMDQLREARQQAIDDAQRFLNDLNKDA